MDYDHEITICVGSSCFSRGNKGVVQAIKKYLEERKLEDRVWFHGTHCYGDCDRGPVMKVDGKLYEHITSSEAVNIIASYFG